MNERDLYQQLLGLSAPWQVVEVRLDPDAREVQVRVEPHPTAVFSCPVCQQPCSGYDAREERRWRHLDSCEFRTWLVTRLPRVQCPTHGVKTVAVPWAEAHSRFTLAFTCFARRVLHATRVQAKTAALLRLTPAEVQDLMVRTVAAGLQRRQTAQQQAVPETAPRHLCLDEKHYGRGQNYLAVLGDAERGQVWEVAAQRTSPVVRTLLTTSLTPEERERVVSVTLDLWQGFLDACRQVLPGATLIYDRFHAAQELNKAVDLTRREEHRRLRQGVPPARHCTYGKTSLSGTRFWWLKRAEELPKAQREQLEQWQREGLETAQVWAQKEAFRAFFAQESVAAGKAFLARWAKEASAVGNAHLQAVVAQFQKHEEKLLAYLEHHRTNALAESLNSAIQAIRTAARGFRRFAGYRQAILFFLGGLDDCPQTFPGAVPRRGSDRHA